MPRLGSHNRRGRELQRHLGLRAIVHLEVFGDPSALAESFEPTAERIAGSLSDRVRLGISPHAPTTTSLGLYAAAHALELPMATHLSESDIDRIVSTIASIMAR